MTDYLIERGLQWQVLAVDGCILGNDVARIACAESSKHSLNRRRIVFARCHRDDPARVEVAKVRETGRHLRPTLRIGQQFDHPLPLRGNNKATDQCFLFVHCAKPKEANAVRALTLADCSPRSCALFRSSSPVSFHKCQFMRDAAAQRHHSVPRPPARRRHIAREAKAHAVPLDTGNAKSLIVDMVVRCDHRAAPFDVDLKDRPRELVFPAANEPQEFGWWLTRDVRHIQAIDRAAIASQDGRPRNRVARRLEPASGPHRQPEVSRVRGSPHSTDARPASLEP